MKNYVVRFYGTARDGDGHKYETCEGSFETPAVDEVQATVFAKDSFCEAGHLVDWSQLADRIEVVEADPPTR